MKLRILSLGIDDLDAGRRFYEKQQHGLGEYFLNSLFSDIDALLLYAGIHPKVFGYFRALSDRFPYAIYYRIEGDEIQVWRVLRIRFAQRAPLAVRCNHLIRPDPHEASRLTLRLKGRAWLFAAPWS